MPTTREKELEAENAALRARLRAELAPRCRGNPMHENPCDECGYCARCHITNFGHPQPHEFTRKEA